MNTFVPLFLSVITLITTALPLSGQDSPGRDEALRVFLDIGRQYEAHVKREIPYVNYMRDRQQAELYIMLTSQRTGSDGREYTIVLYGQQRFTGVNDTLTYVSRQSDTDEMTRNGILQILNLGLMQYVSHTPLSDNIRISYIDDSIAEDDVDDKWDHWVFNIETDTDFDGEESQTQYQLDGSLSADRVTDNWKFSFTLNGEYEEEHYDIDDETITSVRRSWGSRALIVKSLSGHWSAGGYFNTRSSTYSNIDFSCEIAPAVEYNIFPYTESTHREFRILYRAGCKIVDYTEMTIYDRMKEHLWYESLSASFEIKERWGSVEFYLNGSHYFHDFSKNRLTSFTRLNLRLFEGLSLNIRASASRIHDQLSLERGGASEQDILLHRKEIATQYEYSFSVGFRYTFGSIFSNIVNPRFGNGH
ncbi:DUF481 domain-containing protein [bacterium]|nr:DUF481 domain-containing protein [bacterium]